MRRRATLPALLAVAAATSAMAAGSRPDDGAWARFDDVTSASSARAIVASDLPGDAAISSLGVDRGLLVVTGSLGNDHGSRWTTLGAEIASSAGRGAVDLRGSTALRIRLGSAVPRLLRVRLKGPDPQIANAGCYPVVIQQTTTTLTDYTIPLEAFSTPSWCGANAATVEQTLPEVERVEVTANDAPAGTVEFRVGHIDFLAETAPPPTAPAAPAEPDARWRLAWGDDFDGAPGAAASSARWQPDGDVSQDGRGHLTLRPHARADGRPERAALRATLANSMLYGRVEVRLRVPDAGPADALTAVHLALQGLAPAAGAIVMLESDPRGSSFAVGLDVPGTPARGQRVRAPLAMPPDAAFHTIACEWEPDRIRWFVDGALAQERRRDEPIPAAWAGIEQRPLALEVSAGADGDGRAALVLDEVRVWQRDDLAALAAPVLAALRGGTPAPPVVVAAAARRRPAPAPAPVAAATPVASSAPSKRVVCEHSARYELMLCY